MLRRWNSSAAIKRHEPAGEVITEAGNAFQQSCQLSGDETIKHQFPVLYLANELPMDFRTPEPFLQMFRNDEKPI
jgi:hypothetical protein